jgi:hypothetical protein
VRAHRQSRPGRLCPGWRHQTPRPSWSPATSMRATGVAWCASGRTQALQQAARSRVQGIGPHIGARGRAGRVGHQGDREPLAGQQQRQVRPTTPAPRIQMSKDCAMPGIVGAPPWPCGAGVLRRCR